MSEDLIASEAVTPTVKRMRLRYAGTCSRCGTSLEAGATADYDRTSKTVACVECPARRAMPERGEGSAAPRHAITPEAPPELEVVDGTAGGSAAQEFGRRHEARQQRIQTNHPRIGKFLLAVFDDPQSTTAWATGAVGEQRLGEMLAGIAGSTVRVLHDRRIPKTTANIDHLVVCSSGIFVVDAKRYRDARPELRVEGGLFRPRQELLMVGGRDRTKLVEGMHKQVGLVRAALANEPDVPVRGVLCFVDADWPLIGGSFAVQGIDVLWMKKLKAMLTTPGELGADQIADLQWKLHETFPRQKGRNVASQDVPPT